MLYPFLDVLRRKLVGWQVDAEQSVLNSEASKYCALAKRYSPTR
ncbi:hypothetical protein [Pandoraea oxalativorans]|nr:hypothetical protein [Pandoraea oxalativorans]